MTKSHPLPFFYLNYNMLHQTSHLNTGRTKQRIVAISHDIHQPFGYLPQHDTKAAQYFFKQFHSIIRCIYLT